MFSSIDQKLRTIAQFNDLRTVALGIGLDFILFVSKLPVPEKTQIRIADLGTRALVAGVKIARRWL